MNTNTEPLRVHLAIDDSQFPPTDDRIREVYPPILDGVCRLESQESGTTLPDDFDLALVGVTVPPAGGRGFGITFEIQTRTPRTVKMDEDIAFCMSVAWCLSSSMHPAEFDAVCVVGWTDITGERRIRYTGEGDCGGGS